MLVSPHSSRSPCSRDFPASTPPGGFWPRDDHTPPPRAGRPHPRARQAVDHGGSGDVGEGRFLRDTIEVGDSLLSEHLLTLEEAGYVRVEKTFVGKRAQTWLSLTERGRTAFGVYMEVLRRITEGTVRP